MRNPALAAKQVAKAVDMASSKGAEVVGLVRGRRALGFRSWLNLVFKIASNSPQIGRPTCVTGKSLYCCCIRAEPVGSQVLEVCAGIFHGHFSVVTIHPPAHVSRHVLNPSSFAQGAYTSVITRGGLDLPHTNKPASHGGVAITSGNSYVVAATCEAVQMAVCKGGRSCEGLTLAVVGASGSIGRGVAVLLAGKFGCVQSDWFWILQELDCGGRAQQGKLYVA